MSETNEKCCKLDTDGDGNCPIHSSKGILRPHPFEEAPKSCPTCAGEYHDPCPYREEAERNAGEHYRQLPDAAWPWRDVKDHPFSELLRNAYARSLRLADENADLRSKLEHESESVVEKIQAIAALQQRLAEYRTSTRDWLTVEEVDEALTHYGARVQEKAAKIDAALEGLYPWIEHTPGCDSRTEGKECSCGGNKALSNLTAAVTALQNFLSLPPPNEEGVK